MKKTLLILCGALLTFSGFSQKCLTDQMLNAHFDQNAGTREEAYRFMSNLAEKENNNVVVRAADTLITLPVVFHIIHDNGLGNISEEQIADAIRVLNRDLKRQNPDTNQTRNVFKPFAANINVEFRIAKIDPDGFCTNGITRHNLREASYDARNEIKRSSSGGVDAWPVDSYFNVWVVNSIEPSSGTGEGIVLGYAQFPFSWGGGVNETYGIVARQDYLGTIGTSNDDGRMLTHEVGHCLGLFHTFQRGCNTNCTGGGDFICDTPPTSEATYGCDFGQNTCDDPTDDPFSGTSVVDQIENYMSYDNCTNMFSEGQKARMRGVVTNNVNFGGAQDIPQMENLTSAENLEATGVYLLGEPCQVVFESDKNYTCVNTPITFKDFSFARISSWNWSFPGASPETSQEKNPTIIYDAPGTYSITLTIGDSAGNSLDSSYTDFITVTSEDVLSAPYTEAFESGTDLGAINWISVNTDFDDVAWEITTNAGMNSNQSLFLNNFNNDEAGNVDYVISDAFDLSSLTTAVFNFDQFYVMKKSSNREEFRIEISNDCGVSWSTLRGNIGFAIGPSKIVANSSYFPDDEVWRSYSLDIPEAYLTDGVKFRMTFTSDGGNNMFIDNINVANSTVGINENSFENTIRVYPNPFTENATLVITTAIGGAANITLNDILGKEAKVLNDIKLSAGENQINIGRDGLPAGVYLLRVNYESGKKMINKLIIK
jgi:hypothetical protein